MITGCRAGAILPVISLSGRGFFERDTAVSLFVSTKELAGELPHHAKGTLFYCASTERPVDLCLELASFFLRPREFLPRPRRPRFRARRTPFRQSVWHIPYRRHIYNWRHDPNPCLPSAELAR